MRLLYVTPYYKPAWFYGGPPKCIAEQAEYLVQKLGYTVDVVTLNQNGDRPLFADPGVVVQEQAGVRVHYLPATPNWSQRYFYSKILKRYLLRFKCVELVHVHTLFNYFSQRGMSFAREHNIPLVVTPHGMLNQYALQRSAQPKRLHRWLFEDRLLPQAEAVQFTTRIEHATAQLNSLSLQKVFIPNGIHFSDKPASEVVAPVLDELRLVFLGRINRVKGLDLLIDALSCLPSYVRQGTQLDIFGQDDDQYQTVLAAQIQKANLSGRVQFKGRLDATYRNQTLAQYDALVLTSYLENFGLVVAEALDAELPVLVSDQVSLSDFVAEHQCGWVSTLDPADIARQLTALYHTPPAERRARGARGHAAVRAAFNMEKVGGQLDALYRRLART